MIIQLKLKKIEDQKTSLSALYRIRTMFDELTSLHYHDQDQQPLDP